MKPTHKLSIIIPCYNCVATLEESVSSVYMQNLDIPFEIVVVDDGSTDNTRILIKELAKNHNEIIPVFNKRNRGGGAARNMAVAHSSGDLIFCLDSDDILPPGILPQMIDFLDEKRCSGVVFEESRFFSKNNKKITSSARNVVNNTPFKLKDLFDSKKGYLTVINFLYTKNSFYSAGGYPMHHGFDTQSFGHRYLANNFSVFTCPKTFYYHRQGIKKKSYFERVYTSGDFSKNYYLIFEDIMFLFSLDVRRKILEYDIFRNTKLGENNLKSFLDTLYREDPKQFFIKDADRYMHQFGFDVFCNDYKDSDDLMDVYCLAIRAYQAGDYDGSMEYYKKLIKGGFDTKIVYFNMLRVSVAMSGAYEVAQVENKTSDLVGMFAPAKQNINLSPNIFIKGLLKIHRLIKQR